MIGLTRLYCNQGERFLLIDVASEEAPKRAEELLNEAGRSKRQYRSEARQRFTSGLGVAGGMTSLEWGSCAGEQIPQIGEFF